jgi:RimK family alpha-L-glutamate ligase
VDKAWTSALLERAGLPTPETVVCERAEDAFAAFRAMGDVVVKPVFGSMGLGISRVSDEDMAWRVFRVVETVRGVYYVQRFIPHGERDVRAFVIGGQVVGAIERSAPGWRTNFSRGAQVQACALPPAWTDLALRAAEAVGAEYAGVDLLPATDGTIHVLEVNGIPGWEGLQTATGLDVAGLIVDQLLR